ncbi:MAG: hypothetical protein N3A53_08750, partial [Verrucomicrobiae bacterium]|nr:hypothetical protein [Verrucomicrobiae bacterium]
LGREGYATPNRDVFEVSLNMQVTFEEEVDGVVRLRTLQVGNRELINAARGQPFTNSVPANQVLAVLIPCGSPEINLVVYDKVTSNVVVTIAQAFEPSAVQAGNKAVFAIPLPLNSVGHFEGGFLLASGFVTIGTNACALRASAKLAGAFDIILPEGTVTETNRVIVTNGSFATRGRSLGRQ